MNALNCQEGLFDLLFNVLLEGACGRCEVNSRTNIPFGIDIQILDHPQGNNIPV